MYMNKFLINCSCIICKKEITIQSLSQHFNTHFKSPKICPECNKEHHKSGKFCSSSCGAIYSNARKDYSKIKSGPQKGTTPKNFCPYTKVRVCSICGSYHKKSGKTCSKECYKTQLSISLKESKYNFSLNRGRYKKSYLERSFEDWLLSNNYKNFITEQKFKNIHEKKTYYADFYFPDKNLIIELDGSQHKNTVEQDLMRDNYISSEYKLQIIRISHSEYIKKSRIKEIKQLLNIN